MEVFRIARDKYAGSLMASGKAARWNRDNQLVIYTSQSRALSALELVVHRSSLKTALKYRVMVISLPENDRFYTRKTIDSLPENWRDLDAYPALQDIGSNWYHGNESLILQVPSVIVPEEFNYIINLNHPDLASAIVSLERIEDYFWDERLLG
jgi:RES domain-containing protein